MEPEFAPPLSGMQDHSSDAVSMLLATARLRISQGNPASALQAVITALNASGGERAVLQTLARARDVYRNRMNANAAADELASLFAECAIVEADSSFPLPSVSQQQEQPPDLKFHPLNSKDANSMEGCSNSAPILAESGRMQVVFDAFSDGSSFICLKCGGMVSNLRKDEHIAYWCSQSYPG